jgi:hypothetical protein
MKMVRCKIYIDNKGKEKLLVLKLNYLIKHFELSKCIREYFVNPFNVHVKNEKIYESISKILCSFVCKRRKGKNKEVLL